MPNPKLIHDSSKQTKTQTQSTSDEANADQKLIAKVIAGDDSAFEKIMRLYNQRLFRVARSILKDDDEAIDVVQDAYVTAYYQLRSFRGPTGFASWLSRIVSNEALSRLRKLRRLSYTLDDPDSRHLDISSNAPQPLDTIAKRQLRQLLEQAIDQLSLNYRSVYVLRAVQQLSTRETSESLGLTEDVVKTRYKRAKQKLQAVFNDHLEKTGLSSYEFAGHRCDAIVVGVMQKLKNNIN